jgi:hypothetical protein
MVKRSAKASYVVIVSGTDWNARGKGQRPLGAGRVVMLLDGGVWCWRAQTSFGNAPASLELPRVPIREHNCEET